jgi:uncharacterized protein (DUF4213/DUF364 family)
MTTVVEAKGTGILAETLNSIQQELTPEDRPITVERLVIGLFFTGVKLSNGFGGVCYTPIKAIPEAVCCPSSARAMPEPGRVRGRDALELAEQALSGGPLQRVVGIAVVNALGAAALSRRQTETDKSRSYVQLLGDPLDYLQPSGDDFVVVVGALVPYLRFLKARGKPFCVLEQDPATLKADEIPFYAAADRACEKIPQADVLIATGTTLINGTLENLLALAKPTADIILVGPTATMLPDAFFQRGVRIVGGIRVSDPDALLDALAEGGSGYHFLGKSAEKCCLIRSVPAPSLRSKLTYRSLGI